MTTPFEVMIAEDNDRRTAGVVVDFVIHHSVIQAIVVMENGQVVSKKLHELLEAEPPEVF